MSGYTDYLKFRSLSKASILMLAKGFKIFFGEVLINNDVNYDYPKKDFYSLFPKGTNVSEIKLCMRIFNMQECKNSVYFHDILCHAADIHFQFNAFNRNEKHLNSLMVLEMLKRFSTGKEILDKKGYLVEQILIMVLKMNRLCPHLYTDGNINMPNGTKNPLFKDHEYYMVDLSRETVQVVLGVKIGLEYPKSKDLGNIYQHQYNFKNYMDNLDNFIYEVCEVFSNEKCNAEQMEEFVFEFVQKGYGISANGFSEKIGNGNVGYNQINLF